MSPFPQMEIVNPVLRGQVKHVLFDFDGTISLLREGWQGVMIPLIVETLGDTPRGRDEKGLETLARDYVAEHFNRETLAQRYLDLLDDVVAGRQVAAESQPVAQADTSMAHAAETARSHTS